MSRLLNISTGAAVTVDYSVEYPPKDDYPCGVGEAPISNPVSVVIPAGGSAFQVMETAVNSFGSQYKFTATYFGSLFGYLIDAINGVPCAVTQLPPSVCYWEFYIKFPNGTVTSSSVGVSKYTFNSDGYGMIMRYHDSSHNSVSELSKFKEGL